MLLSVIEKEFFLQYLTLWFFLKLVHLLIVSLENECISVFCLFPYLIKIPTLNKLSRFI